MAVELGTKSLEKLLYAAGLKHSFVMTNFSKERLKDKQGNWKSPPMYTHTKGYKFCVLWNWLCSWELYWREPVGHARRI